MVFACLGETLGQVENIISLPYAARPFPTLSSLAEVCLVRKCARRHLEVEYPLIEEGQTELPLLVA